METIDADAMDSRVDAGPGAASRVPKHCFAERCMTASSVLVLRRFETEALEVVALVGPSAAPSLAGPPGCSIHAWTDGEMRVYRVELPDGYVVRPVDWRRFASDPVQIRARIEACVNDNLGASAFEPWSDSALSDAQGQLTMALRDLSSIIEVLEVHCDVDREAGAILVTVDYVDVFRRRHNLVVSFGLLVPGGGG